MSATDRKRLGKAGKTVAELTSAQEIKSEKELQRQCVALLRQRGIFVVVSRMDKRTSNQVGTPDLLFAFNGRACAFECKLPTGTISEAQDEVMARMEADKWCVRVIHSAEEMRDELRKLETT